MQKLTLSLPKKLILQSGSPSFGIYKAGIIILHMFVLIFLLRTDLWSQDIPDNSPGINPLEASIAELQHQLDSGQTTSVDLVEFYLKRIGTYDKNGPALNSIASINPKALEEAKSLDTERKEKGKRGPLHGIPILVKDNYETRGMPTEAGSKTLEGYAPDRDAELVSRLREAGAIILAKTNMHEFAYGIETWGSSFGKTRNPYDPTRNPGGSSGGTGAAVAANFAVAGLGSDTCGSIRYPASHNSLVGLRGTQGASSRSGIIPLSSTQDIGGPLARSVADLATILDVTVGYDPEDPQTAVSFGRFNGSFLDKLDSQALDGKRIGIVEELLPRGPGSEDVAAVFDEAVEQMSKLGVEIEFISLPFLENEMIEQQNGYYVLVHDFGRDLNSYLSTRNEAPVESLDEIIAMELAIPEVQVYLQESRNAQDDPSEVYMEELVKRDQLKQAIYEVMAEYKLDALAYPTTKTIAAKTELQQSENNCQLSANSGFPAITVPAGFSKEGMPVGLELLGRPWNDSILVGMAYSFEQATRHRRPPNFDGEE
jgi:Asp-tRNA(Asn)/Glu-tRNA(Gln) amidotransferase A subunit family amidase